MKIGQLHSPLNHPPPSINRQPPNQPKKFSLHPHHPPKLMKHFNVETILTYIILKFQYIDILLCLFNISHFAHSCTKIIFLYNKGPNASEI